MNSVGAFIEGVEYALPAREVTNDDLDRAHPEWRIADVVRRTGVRSRRWATNEETSLDLGAEAAQRLLARIGTPVTAIDAVLFCTQSPDYFMPPNACLLQSRLGMPSTTAALDFSLACSGFIYGLYLGSALVTSGSAERVLLVTAETYSKLMSPDDRGPATLFGDGGAATLIARGTKGISRVMLGTDGSNPKIFCIPAGGARTPRSEEADTLVVDRFGNRRSATQIVMDGAAVLAFVDREVIPFVRRALVELSASWETIDLVVFHQASQATLDVLTRKLGIPVEKVFSNLDCVGNAVSASIPIALRQAEERGRLVKGMRVLVVGFGVGMSWGATILCW